MSPDARLDPTLRARVLVAVSRDAAPTLAVVRRRSRITIALFAVVALAVFLWAGGFRDWGMPRSPWLVTASAGGIATIASVVTYLALDRGRSMLGRPSHQLCFVVVVAPLVFFMWKVVWSALFDGGLDAWPTRVGHRCLALGSTMGLLLVVGYSLALRGERARPILGGGAMGMAAGMMASVFVELWCPVGHPIHVLYGHLTPILLVGGVGAVLGSMLLRLWR